MVHTVGQQQASMYQGGNMPKKQELRTKQFRCLDNGHRFSEQVSSWVRYIEEIGEPGPERV
jgi:hypothetical protein